MNHQPKHILLLALLFLAGAPARAQFLDSTTGLLQAPSAVMNREGTFMITTNYINHHALSPIKWRDYNTYSYGLDVALWDRVEIAYVCTFMSGWAKEYEPAADYEYYYWINQDRHLSGKILLLREGDFGISWLPNFAVGISDIDQGMFRHRIGNGYFTRFYGVASKSFKTAWGDVGGHLGYQWNPRKDYPINAPCAGIDWKPVWLQTNWLSLDLIAEFDSRTFNVGFIASLWDDHLEAMFDLQALKWVSFGLRYKMHLRN